MSRLYTFLCNELKLLFRDKRALLLLFLMPALMVLILSSILTNLYKNQKPNIRILVNSAYQTPVGDQLVSSLKESQKSVEFSVKIPEDASRQYDLLIRIPSDLSEQLRVTGAQNEKGSQEKVEFVFYKFMDPFQKTFLMHEFVRVLQGQIIEEINKELVTQKTGVLLLSDPSSLVVESKAYGARDFSPLSFSLIAWSLFAIFFIVVPFSNSFFRDWNNDILLRLKSMKISKGHVLGGRILSYLIINFAQFLFLLILGLFVYPLILKSDPIQIQSFAALLLVVFVTSLTATAYALFISCAAKTQEQASALGSFGVVILSLIGGIMIPTVFMPEFMVKFVAICSPLYWGLSAFSEALQKQVDWQNLLNSLFILVLFALSFFGLSLRLFNWEKK